MKRKAIQYVLTCEHAGNEIPQSMSELVKIPRSVLNSHRGYDIGAYDVAKEVSDGLNGKLFSFSISRLLIDANRDLKAKTVTSKYTQDLSNTQLNSLKREYLSYRYGVEKFVRKCLNQGKPVVVFSVHSFTPIFEGYVRKTDIGLLYRTSVEKEQVFARRLKKTMNGLAVHLNRPYRGHTDCFLNDLAEPHLADSSFVSLFLEVNQNQLRSRKRLSEVSALLVSSIKTIEKYPIG